jgi:hypothetical protein
MDEAQQPRKRRRGAREAASDKPKPAKTYNNPYAAIPAAPAASTGAASSGAATTEAGGASPAAAGKKRPGKSIKKGDADYLSPTQLRNARKRKQASAAKALAAASAPVIGEAAADAEMLEKHPSNSIKFESDDKDEDDDGYETGEGKASEKKKKKKSKKDYKPKNKPSKVVQYFKSNGAELEVTAAPSEAGWRTAGSIKLPCGKVPEAYSSALKKLVGGLPESLAIDDSVQVVRLAEADGAVSVTLVSDSDVATKSLITTLTPLGLQSLHVVKVDGSEAKTVHGPKFFTTTMPEGTCPYEVRVKHKPQSGLLPSVECPAVFVKLLRSYLGDLGEGEMSVREYNCGSGVLGLHVLDLVKVLGAEDGNEGNKAAWIETVSSLPKKMRKKATWAEGADEEADVSVVNGLGGDVAAAAARAKRAVVYVSEGGAKFEADCGVLESAGWEVKRGAGWQMVGGAVQLASVWEKK